MKKPIIKRLSWAIAVLVPSVLMLGACTINYGNSVIDFPGVERKSVSIQTQFDGPIEVSYVKTISENVAENAATDTQKVIFVHGTPGDASVWNGFLSDVPDGYQYISVDRPGFGSSKPEKSFVSLDTQAEALLPFLETSEGPKPILVGHSLGGPVVAAAAAKYPEKIGGILIVAGSLDPELEEVLWVQYLGTVPPFSWILDKPLKHANDELIGLEKELRKLQTNLNQVNIPVVIIHGTEDDLVPYGNVAFMQTEFTSTDALKVVTLDGLNHFLPWNSKDVIDREIVELSTHLASADNQPISTAR